MSCLTLRQFLQLDLFQRHAIFTSELFRALDPFGYLEFVEPRMGLIQMRCGCVVVALGVGERCEVEVGTC